MNTYCDVTQCMNGWWIFITKLESPKGDSQTWSSPPRNNGTCVIINLHLTVSWSCGRTSVSSANRGPGSFYCLWFSNFSAHQIKCYTCKASPQYMHPFLVLDRKHVQTKDMSDTNTRNILDLLESVAIRNGNSVKNYMLILVFPVINLINDNALSLHTLVVSNSRPWCNLID